MRRELKCEGCSAPIPRRDSGKGRQRRLCDDCLIDRERARERRRWKSESVQARVKRYRSQPHVRLARNKGLTVFEAKRELARRERARYEASKHLDAMIAKITPDNLHQPVEG